MYGSGQPYVCNLTFPLPACGRCDRVGQNSVCAKQKHTHTHTRTRTRTRTRTCIRTRTHTHLLCLSYRLLVVVVLPAHCVHAALIHAIVHPLGEPETLNGAAIRVKIIASKYPACCTLATSWQHPGTCPSGNLVAHLEGWPAPYNLRCIYGSFSRDITK